MGQAQLETTQSVDLPEVQNLDGSNSTATAWPNHWWKWHNWLMNWIRNRLVKLNGLTENLLEL